MLNLAVHTVDHWALECKQVLSLLQVVNFTLRVQTHTGSETNIHSCTELIAKCLLHMQLTLCVGLACGNVRAGRQTLHHEKQGSHSGTAKDLPLL